MHISMLLLKAVSYSAEGCSFFPTHMLWVPRLWAPEASAFLQVPGPQGSRLVPSPGTLLPGLLAFLIAVFPVSWVLRALTRLHTHIHSLGLHNANSTLGILVASSRLALGTCMGHPFFLNNTHSLGVCTVTFLVHENVWPKEQLWVIPYEWKYIRGSIHTRIVYIHM